MSESGFFYGTFVDPLLKRMRKRAAHHITPGQTVLDVACGTGAQLLETAGYIGKSVGIDHSESMIRRAKKSAGDKGYDHISFMLYDAALEWPFSDKQFDVAVLSLALHQFSPVHYHIILNEMKRVARKQIIIDYAIPLPKNIFGKGSKFAEFLAGREHYINFMHYSRVGGVRALLPQHHLVPRIVENFAKNVFQLTVCF